MAKRKKEPVKAANVNVAAACDWLRVSGARSRDVKDAVRKKAQALGVSPGTPPLLDKNSAPSVNVRSLRAFIDNLDSTATKKQRESLAKLLACC